MPVLKQRGDGGFYARGVVQAAGAFATWQITDEGAAYLRRHGVHIDETIPGTLWHVLREGGAAYTGHSGLGGYATQMHPAGIDPKAKAVLAIREMEGSWSLGLAVSDWPREWFHGGDEAVSPDALSQCRLVASDGSYATAMELWPGGGGKFVPVPSADRDYRLDLQGPWPAQWRSGLEAWTTHVAALDPNGTLFLSADEGGIRLRPGAPLDLGATYYFARRINDRSAGWSPPAGLTARALGPRSGWDAWLIEFSQEASTAVKQFARQLGHELRFLPWKLGLVSPPPLTYLANGIAVVPMGEEIVVSATPSGQSEILPLLLSRETKSVVATTITGDRPGEPVFLSFVMREPGLHCLASVEGYSASLLLVADVPPVAGVPETPRPLTVRVSTDRGEVLLAAYASTLSQPLVCVSAAPSVELECPVAIELTWQADPSLRGSTRLQTVEVASRMIELWTSARRVNHDLTAELDAGTYGRLTLQVTCARGIARAQRLGGAPQPRRALLWLLRRRVRRNERLVSLSASTAQTLSGIDADSATRAQLAMTRVTASVRSQLLHKAAARDSSAAGTRDDD